MSSYLHGAYHLFQKALESVPDHAALVWSDREVVSFRELDRLANRVAFTLQQRGVHKGDRIGIRLEKCTLAYALILACLKLGAPYFAIDPSNPLARVLHLLEKCQPSLIFSTRAIPLDLPPAYHVVQVDQQDPFATSDSSAQSFATEQAIVGTDPAYIMFTSGSTGFPKGAVMSHANLLNFVHWAKVEFSVAPADRFTGVNPLFFDNSVFDFYASVMNGAALVPFDAATMGDPYGVLKRIDDLRCTVYFSVPSLLIYFQTLKMINPTSFPHLRCVAFGGEGYPKTKLKELFTCLSSRMELVNVYGPTECTCICSAYRLSEADFEDLDGYPPLGGPIENFSFTILNESGQPAALDAAGELLLGGPCVGLGYYNDPELTEAAFRQNPLNQSYDERIYATGDLVMRSSRDLKVHFVGRKDSQIKHQGYRIELEEIEHALRSLPGVNEAMAMQSSKDGFSTIVAVVASEQSLDMGSLRQQLSTRLPDYMIPARLEVFDRLPKNANGKIDRTLLKCRYC